MLKLGSEIRNKFSILAEGGGRPRLAYLDTAASAQKPDEVLLAMDHFAKTSYANIHRGAYKLSELSTLAYDQARSTIARFIGTKNEQGVIFTSGTTESINLVAYSYGQQLNPGDCVLLSMLEHHSNIVPWQLLARRRGVQIKFVGLNEVGELDMQQFQVALQTHRPKIVACTHISNALGTTVDVKNVVDLAHQAGALVLIDAAQSVPHMALEVDQLGADFVAFSGHKLYGPTGIGVLYGKPQILDGMEPFLGGGDMINSVSTDGVTFAELPAKFEAGTPPIIEAVGLQAACHFVNQFGIENIRRHEEQLCNYARLKLAAEPGITLYGPAAFGRPSASILPFNVEGVHPHDLATIADTKGVQLRAGHHCAMPLLRALGVHSTARISFGMYSSEADIDQLLYAIRDAQKLFVAANREPIFS